MFCNELHELAQINRCCRIKFYAKRTYNTGLIPNMLATRYMLPYFSLAGIVKT